MVLQFVAKQPQVDWATAAVWTGPKFVGGNDARDMNVTPAMGIVEVRKSKKGVNIDGLDQLFVFPNPTEGEVVIQFQVDVDSEVNLNVSDLVGRKILEILNEKMPAGEYKYVAELNELANGMYIVSLKTSTTVKSNKIFINK